MEYVGLQTQIWRNNTRSIALLIAFPALLLLLVWSVFLIVELQSELSNFDRANDNFLGISPFILIGVLIWFAIAWAGHSRMIRKATSSKPLERAENKRVYNLVENLCIAEGMRTPQVFIINDTSLNAFASGINEKTYAVTLSQGIIDKLDDAELQGVIAHELTHIQNRDVRLLIVSIIFVGVFAFISEAAFRTGIRSGGRSGKKGGVAIILIILVAAIAYVVSKLLGFAISRKREFMADAGAARMTKDPAALANALKKINEDPRIEAVEREDVAQLFIEHPLDRKKKGFLESFSKLFATHPPIQDRIQVLEQF